MTDQKRYNAPLFSSIKPFISSGHYAVNVGWDYLEQHLNGLFEQGLNIDPDFQRAHVWREKQQREYVEFILRRGDSSRTVLLNCPGWHEGLTRGEFVLVDGKQRLEAVRKFLRNELLAFGYKYNEYGDKLYRAGRPDFIFQTNDLETRAEVLEWYLQLNSGGVMHTSTELNRVRDLLNIELKTRAAK